MDDELEQLLKEAHKLLGREYKPKKTAPAGLKDDDIPRILDDEFSKLGYAPNARLSLLGNVGRENSWKVNTVFGTHSDPKNAQKNTGIISWQKDRRDNLFKYLKKNGGDISPSEGNLRLMARFLDDEMRTGFGKVYKRVKDPNVSTSEASRALRDYIKYVPNAPYNTPDREFDTVNNRQWAEKARKRGLGAFTPQSDPELDALEAESRKLLGGDPELDALEAESQQLIEGDTPRFDKQGNPIQPGYDAVDPMGDPSMVDTPEATSQMATPDTPTQTSSYNTEGEFSPFAINKVNLITAKLKLPEAVRLKFEQDVKAGVFEDTPEGFNEFIALQNEDAQKLVQSQPRQTRGRQPVAPTLPTVAQPEQEQETLAVPAQDPVTGRTLPQGSVDVRLNLRAKRPNQTYKEFFDEETTREIMRRTGVSEQVAREVARRQPYTQFSEEEFQAAEKNGQLPDATTLQVSPAVFADAMASQKRLADKSSRKEQYLAQGLSDNEAELEAMLQSGMISPEQYSTIKYQVAQEAEKQKALAAKFRDEYQLGFFSNLSPSEMRQGNITPDDMEAYRTGQADEALARVLQMYGGNLESYYKDKERIASEYQYRYMAAPSEFALNVVRYFANLPAKVGQMGAVLANEFNAGALGDPVGDATQSPFYQFWNGWEQRINESKNKDIREGVWQSDLGNFTVNTMADTLGQLGAQALLAPLTGGLSLGLPLTEAGLAQYKDAAKGGASRETRMLATAVGAAAAVPDALLNATFLKAITPGKFGAWVERLSDRMFASLSKSMPEAAARTATEGFLKGMLERGAFGALAESTQEATEDIINKATAKLTYKPEITWSDVFIPNTDEKTGYLAAGIAGAFGMNIETVVEKMSDSEISKAPDAIGEAIKRSLSYEDAQTVARAVQSVADTRGIRLAQTPLMRDLLKPVAAENAVEKFLAAQPSVEQGAIPNEVDATTEQQGTVQIVDNAFPEATQQPTEPATPVGTFAEKVAEARQKIEKQITPELAQKDAADTVTFSTDLSKAKVSEIVPALTANAVEQLRGKVEGATDADIIKALEGELDGIDTKSIKGQKDVSVTIKPSVVAKVRANVEARQNGITVAPLKVPEAPVKKSQKRDLESRVPKKGVEETPVVKTEPATKAAKPVVNPKATPKVNTNKADVSVQKDVVRKTPVSEKTQTEKEVGQKEPWEMTDAELTIANRNAAESGDSNRAKRVYDEMVKRSLADQQSTVKTKTAIEAKQELEYFNESASSPISLDEAARFTPSELKQYNADQEKRNKALRRAKVTKALRENKPVPAEVLADYPDLAKKYAQKPTVTEAEAASKEVKTPVVKGEDVQDVVGKGNVFEDYGEKIGGAKKDYVRTLAAITEEQIQTLPLSKILPRPDFKSAIADGVMSRDVAKIVAFAHSVIPAKPRKKWKITRWAENVQQSLEIIRSAFEGKGEAATKLIEGARQKGYFTLADKFEGYSAILDKIGFPEQDAPKLHGLELVKFYNKNADPAWAITEGRQIISEWKTVNEAAKEIVKLARRRAEGANTKPIEFSVYRDRQTNEFFVGKKGGGDVTRLATGFPTSKEAFAFLKANQDKLEAMWNGLKVDVGFERREGGEEIREGRDWRKGKDITSTEEFAKQFGFRAVEFGNWVKNTATKNERQAAINDSYDALMDLADVLGLDPKALSLNGTLAFALGARGSGTASAHYEPMKVVINLTKTRGKGSLAHEWWHALDNYFARMRKDTVGYVTENPSVRRVRDGMGFADDPSVRKETLAAYRGVVDAIKASKLPARSAVLDAARSKRYFSTIVEMTARAFENYVVNRLGEKGLRNDYLAAFKDMGEWVKGGVATEAFPYPLEDEQSGIDKAYDDLFGILESETTAEGNVILKSVSSIEDWDSAAFDKELDAIKLTRDKDGKILAPNGKVSNIQNERLAKIMRSNRGSFSPDDNSILFSKATNDRRSILHKLKYADIDFVISQADSRIDKNGNLEMNEAAQELLRTALEEAGISDSVQDGVMMPSNVITMVAGVLDRLAKRMQTKAYGYSAEELAPMTSLVEQLKRLGSDKVGIAYVYEEALPEENVHKEDWLLGRAQPSVVEALKKDKDLWDGGETFKAQYPEISDYNRASELAAKLATDQAKKYGWDKLPDFEKRKNRFLKTWARGILKKNEQRIKEMGEEAFAQTFPTIYKYGNTKKGDGKGSRSGGVDATPTQGSTKSEPVGQVAQEEKGQKSGVAPQAEEAKQESDKRLPDDAERKVASFSRILGQVEYDPQTNEVTKQKAQQLVTAHGGNLRDAAMATLDNRRPPSAEGMLVVYQYFSALNQQATGLRTMGMEAEAEIVVSAIADLANRIIERQVATGQEVQIARLLEPLSPEVSLLTVVKMRKYNSWWRTEPKQKDEPLTPDQTKEILDLHADITRYRDAEAKARQELADAERKLRLYQSEKKGQRASNRAGKATQATLLKQYKEKESDLLAKLREHFPSAPQFNAAQMVAWHGSPHQFDKFSTEKIGTGEGAQAYGWGLYFADKESVADHYRSALTRYSQPELLYKGEPIDRLVWSEGTRDALAVVKREYDKDVRNAPLSRLVFRAKRHIKDVIHRASIADRYPDKSENYFDERGINLEYLKKEKSRAIAALDALQSLDIADLGFTESIKGAKYKVDLKPAEDEYLLWDKPLSEQSEKVTEAIKIAAESRRSDVAQLQQELTLAKNWVKKASLKTRIDNLSQELKTGEELYHRIEAEKGSKAASEYLKSLGIRGIKYLDGSSRSKGEGDYNYVIFDDADVEITEVLKSVSPTPLSDEEMELLAEYATGQILQNLPYKDLIDTLTTMTGADLEQIKDVHAMAVETIRNSRPTMSDAQREALKTRMKHYRESIRWVNRDVIKPKQPPKNAVLDEIKQKSPQDAQLIEAVRQLTDATKIRSVENVIGGLKKQFNLTDADARSLAQQAQAEIKTARASIQARSDKEKGIDRTKLEAEQKAKAQALRNLAKYLTDKDTITSITKEVAQKFPDNAELIYAVQMLTDASNPRSVLTVIGGLQKQFGLNETDARSLAQRAQAEIKTARKEIQARTDAEKGTDREAVNAEQKARAKELRALIKYLNDKDARTPVTREIADKFPDDEQLIYAAQVLTDTTQIRSINNVINDIKTKFGLTESQAETLAKRAQKEVIVARADIPQKRDDNRKVTAEKRAELEKIRIDKLKAINKLNRFLNETVADPNAMKRSNNIIRGAVVNNWGTQLFNATQTIAVTTPYEMLLDILDAGIMQQFGINIGENNADIRLRDVWTPLAYNWWLTKRLTNTAERALAHFPEQWLEMHKGLMGGDIDVKPHKYGPTKKNIFSKAIHTALDFGDLVNSKTSMLSGAMVQEAHFRNAVAMAYLDMTIKKKTNGEKGLTTALDDGSFDKLIAESDVRIAVSRAMKATMAESVSDPAGRFLLNMSRTMDNFYPVILNPIMFARFTYTVSRNFVINPLLFGALDSKRATEIPMVNLFASGEGYNNRSLAKGILAYGSIIGAYLLKGMFDNDDDKWYTLNVFGEVIDVRRWFPIAPAFFAAHILRRWWENKPFTNSKTWWGSVEEVLGGLFSIESDYFQYGAGVNAIYTAADVLTNGDSLTDDLPKIESAAGRLAGAQITMLLRFLKPVKDVAASLTQAESALREYDRENNSMDAFMEEIAKTLPVAGLYGAPEQVDPVTGLVRTAKRPMARWVGGVFVDDNNIPKAQSAATMWAERYFGSKGSGGKMTLEQILRQRLINAMRKREITTTDAERILTEQIGKGTISEEQAKSIAKVLVTPEIVTAITGFGTEGFNLYDKTDAKNIRVVINQADEKEVQNIKIFLDQRVEKMKDKNGNWKTPKGDREADTLKHYQILDVLIEDRLKKLRQRR